MRRARSLDQKEERRRSILEAARRLWRADGFGTMEALAAEAGVAKGTLYLYFRAREEVLLAVLGDDMDAWLAELTERLPRLPADGLPGELVEDLAHRPMMVDLLTRLGTTLETNVDEAAARAFKVRMMSRVVPLGEELDRMWVSVAPGTGVRFCLWFFALLVGIRQLAEPAPAARRAVEADPALAALRVDFQTELRAVLEATVAGLRARGAG